MQGERAEEPRHGFGPCVAVFVRQTTLARWEGEMRARSRAEDEMPSPRMHTGWAKWERLMMTRESSFSWGKEV